MSVKPKSAEIEYKDMIRYVDKVLKFKGDEWLRPCRDFDSRQGLNFEACGVFDAYRLTLRTYRSDV